MMIFEAKKRHDVKSFDKKNTTKIKWNILFTRFFDLN